MTAREGDSIFANCNSCKGTFKIGVLPMDIDDLNKMANAVCKYCGVPRLKPFEVLEHLKRVVEKHSSKKVNDELH